MPEPTTEEVQQTVRKKLDSGVVQIRSRDKWVMYDQKALEKALNRLNAELAAGGKKRMTRQIRVAATKDL